MNTRYLAVHLGVATVLLAPFITGFVHGYQTAEVVDCSTYAATGFGMSPQRYCTELLGTEQEQRMEEGVWTGLNYTLALLVVALIGMIIHGISEEVLKHIGYTDEGI